MEKQVDEKVLFPLVIGERSHHELVSSFTFEILMMGGLTSMLLKKKKKALTWTLQSLMSQTSFGVAVTALLVPNLSSKTHSLLL